MQQHKFHLDLENSVIKTNRDKFSVKMVERATRKVTSQRNNLPRAMEARPCQKYYKRFKMAETEAPCRRVVLKSEAVRKQKVLDTHHRRNNHLMSTS